MNNYIKRGISSLTSVAWDPDRVDKKAISTAKEIKKEHSYRIKEKEKEKERKKMWESTFTQMPATQKEKERDGEPREVNNNDKPSTRAKDTNDEDLENVPDDEEEEDVFEELDQQDDEEVEEEEEMVVEDD